MKVKIKQFGFTLVEVLIVVALIVVLVSMVIIATNKSRVDTQEQLTRATIEVLDTALQEYYDYTNDFPYSDLISTEDDPTWRNASLYVQLNLVPDSRKILSKLADSKIRMVDDEVISFTDRWGTNHEQEGYLLVLDAWETPLDYLYELGNTFPMIISAGPDRNFDTPADNIDNRD